MKPTCTCSLGNGCKLCPTLKSMNDGMPITLKPKPKLRPKCKHRHKEGHFVCGGAFEWCQRCGAFRVQGESKDLKCIWDRWRHPDKRFGDEKRK